MLKLFFFLYALLGSLVAGEQLSNSTARAAQQRPELFGKWTPEGLKLEVSANRRLQAAFAAGANRNIKVRESARVRGSNTKQESRSEKNERKLYYGQYWTDLYNLKGYTNWQVIVEVPSAAYNSGELRTSSNTECDTFTGSPTLIVCEGAGVTGWVSIADINTWPDGGVLYYNLKAATTPTEFASFTAKLPSGGLVEYFPIELGPVLTHGVTSAGDLIINRPAPNELTNVAQSLIDHEIHTTSTTSVTGWVCDYLNNPAWEGFPGLHPHKSACAHHATRRRRLVATCIFDVIVIVDAAWTAIDIGADYAITVTINGVDTNIAAGATETFAPADFGVTSASDSFGYTIAPQGGANPAAGQEFFHTLSDGGVDELGHSVMVNGRSAVDEFEGASIGYDNALNEVKLPFQHNPPNANRFGAGYVARTHRFNAEVGVLPEIRAATQIG